MLNRQTISPFPLSLFSITFLSKIILTESGLNGDSKLDLVGMQHPWAVFVFRGMVCCEKQSEMSKKEGAFAKDLI